MTRATLTKLLILVILAFIVCLPDFFTLHRASKVDLLCMPYRNCEQDSQVRSEENGNIGVAEIRRGDMCDPSPPPERGKWERACTQESQRNMTDPASEDPEKRRFMCTTDMDMAELHRNHSSSALNEHFELSVELQLRDADALNLTLYRLNNHNFLHLHPPVEVEEEDDGEEEGKKKMNDKRRSEAFFCCLPALPTPGSASQSRCLLWIDNQTVLAETAQEKLKDEWRCVFWVLWLVLLAVMLLTIVTIVLLKIYWGRYKKPRVHPLCSDLSCHHLKDGEKHTDIIPKGTISHSNEPRAELSPIQEVDSQAGLHLSNLHHRSHHMTPPSQRSRPRTEMKQDRNDSLESTAEKNKNDSFNYQLSLR